MICMWRVEVSVDVFLKFVCTMYVDLLLDLVIQGA
jgi:hypothetical protein